jgi:tetratricopeptide (TPR) repeat protein
MSGKSSSDYQALIDKMVADRVHPKEIFAVVKEAHGQYPKDVEIVWRFARAHYQLGETVEHDQKYELFKAGLAAANEALSLNDKHFGGHKWTAILLSSCNEFETVSDRIKNSFKIREHLETALKHNSEDATVLFALGKWCWMITHNLSGAVVKTLVSAIFAKPPESSYDEAIGFLMRVEELLKTKGDYFADLKVRNKVLLGDCYYQQSNYEKAKQWYKAAIDLPVVSNVDKQNHDDAEAKIGKCTSWW